MTHVKICGITNEDDASLVQKLGADFLGMIFVASSQRHVQLDTARIIADRLRNQIQIVGVFQNSRLSEVNEIAEELNLDLVQLHGTEDPEYCEQVERPVIKVVHLNFTSVELEQKGKTRKYDDVALVSELQRYPSNVEYFLFDKPKTTDGEGWLENALARLHRIQGECRLPPYFFAGGLNPLNVAHVIELLRPFGVDVASGIEARPGIKDKRLMADFIQTALATKQENSTC